MAAYKLSGDAAEDFARIFEYGIDQFGLHQANTYIEGLEKRFIELTANPMRCQPVEHIRKGYRRSVYGVHSIYFKLSGETVAIMRILGREDVRQI